MDIIVGPAVQLATASVDEIAIWKVLSYFVNLAGYKTKLNITVI